MDMETLNKHANSTAPPKPTPNAPPILRMLELEALSSLAKNGNARIYIGFPANCIAPDATKAEYIKNRFSCRASARAAFTSVEPKSLRPQPLKPMGLPYL